MKKLTLIALFVLSYSITSIASASGFLANQAIVAVDGEFIIACIPTADPRERQNYILCIKVHVKHWQECDPQTGQKDGKLTINPDCRGF